MKQGTTTTFKVKQFDLPDITEIIFSFTNDKNNVVVERTTPTTDDGQIHKSYPSEVSLEDGFYKIGLDQDETLSLNETFYVEAQIMFSGAVTKAYIDKVKMPHTFYTKVISGATTNGEEIELAMELSDVIEIEGGGSSNYNDLTNKPRINNTELIGNKTDTDLGLATKTELNAKQNTITGGNGIDVTSDVVSVDLLNGESVLGFSNGKLKSDLSAYYTKTETYSKTEINAKPKAYVGTGKPSYDIANYPNINIGDMYIDKNFFVNNDATNRTWVAIDITDNHSKVVWQPSQRFVFYGQTPYTTLTDFTSATGCDYLYHGTLFISMIDGGLYQCTDNSEPFTWTKLATVDDLSGYQPKLTAGTNITIVDNVISASGGGLSYTFTDGLTESSGTVGIDLKSGTELQITNDQLDIDLSSYATTTDLSSKQDTIDSTHKLSADLVTDTSATNKFVPTHSSTESGKVLGVDTNGDLEWTTKGSGGSYSGGDGIDITNDTISVDLKSGTELQITSGELDIDLSNYATTTSVSGKEDKTTISTDTTSTTVSLTLVDNNEYRFTQDLTSLTLTMPNGDFISSIVFASGSTPTSMTYDSSIKWSGDDITNGQFVPQANMEYEIVFWFNGLSINAVVRGVA